MVDRVQRDEGNREEVASKETQTAASLSCQIALLCPSRLESIDRISIEIEACCLLTHRELSSRMDSSMGKGKVESMLMLASVVLMVLRNKRQVDKLFAMTARGTSGRTRLLASTYLHILQAQNTWSSMPAVTVTAIRVQRESRYGRYKSLLLGPRAQRRAKGSLQQSTAYLTVFPSQDHAAKRSRDACIPQARLG